MKKLFMALFTAFTVCTSLLWAQEKSNAQVFVEKMGIGINLGNTMEATGNWVNKKGGVRAYETCWGSPVITKEIIQGYADAGFKTLRIPVAWSNLMSADGKYTVSPELLNRVQQIVDWTLECGMYPLVNEHWDGGWWEQFPSKKEESMKHYKAIWTAVLERFKDYDERLVLESLNEEGGWNSLWNRYGGTTGKDKSYALLNEINQTFVDMARASGGYNATRLLLIAGYQTDIGLTCDPLFVMPEDPAKMCAVSVHYYTPSNFAILDKDADWGKNRTTWGTPKDVTELAMNMKKMKTTFVDKGIPVIIGEYGCPTKNKEQESIQNYVRLVALHAYKNGMCPVLWDIQKKGTAEDPFSHYDRRTGRIVDPVVQENFRNILETVTR
ncbi:MAG: glycoside hydrolase family 5 protein [Treponema sp.]|nr:glycoside hydrolase family 5 protein [Treponema sp.]